MANGDKTNGATDPSREVAALNGRDLLNHRLSQPINLKTVAILVSLAAALWGSAKVWGSFTATSEIADATTKAKLSAIETQHNKDIEQQRSALQEFDHDLHELDTKQAVMRTEQKQQTELLKEIRTDIKKAHGSTP